MLNFLNLQYLYNQIYQLLTGGQAFSGIIGFLRGIVLFWKIFALIITPILLLVIIVISIRRSRLKEETAEEAHSLIDTTAEPLPQNPGWQKIQKYMSSDHPAEWKLAILEADNILDLMVQKMGYPGENLGERLKGIEMGDFASLDDAWEAHKVRNRIAHDSDFILNRREAERIIGLYKKVFEEFKLI